MSAFAFKCFNEHFFNVKNYGNLLDFFKNKRIVAQINFAVEFLVRKQFIILNLDTWFKIVAYYYFTV